VISFDVRAGNAVPEGPVERYGIVVGTGGPGSLDPRENDGVSETSQGVLEDQTWEKPLFDFFDRVLAAKSVSLLGICHTFGLLARWSGFAAPALRPQEKGGKSTGVKLNVLTEAGLEHPWFSALDRVNGGPEFAVLDSRLYDLIPAGPSCGCGTALAFERRGAGAGPGEAVTMVEYSRDGEGSGPRVWGVNFHPEIGDRGAQRQRLARLAARGEVSLAWFEERRKALDAWDASDATQRGLQWTSSMTFEGPLHRIVARLLQERRRSA
jgi:hypothetical protein